MARELAVGCPDNTIGRGRGGNLLKRRCENDETNGQFQSVLHANLPHASYRLPEKAAVMPGRGWSRETAEPLWRIKV